jgi:hypothetical protein
VLTAVLSQAELESRALEAHELLDRAADDGLPKHHAQAIALALNSVVTSTPQCIGERRRLASKLMRFGASRLCA